MLRLVADLSLSLSVYTMYLSRSNSQCRQPWPVCLSRTCMFARLLFVAVVRGTDSSSSLATFKCQTSVVSSKERAPLVLSLTRPRHQMSFPEIMAVLEAVQSLADKTSIPMDQFRTRERLGAQRFFCWLAGVCCFVDMLQNSGMRVRQAASTSAQQCVGTRILRCRALLKWVKHDVTVFLPVLLQLEKMTRGFNKDQWEN